MSQRLQAAWLEPGGLSAVLRPASWVYGALFALRRFLYQIDIFKSTRLSVPVIVVGNVVAGGAGKTPVVIEIVRHLQSQGWQVGVVSRGYGREVRREAGREGAKSTQTLEVNAATPVAQSGDEPALIYQSTLAPVFVAASRVAAGQALLAAYPGTQVMVCDDGLQHLALQRDIEICVFDERGVGNGHLLPAGPLREHWPRKVDFVLHAAPTGSAVKASGSAASDSSTAQSFVLHRRLAAYALRADGSRVPLSALAGSPVHALAGIAKPEAFFDMLRSAGLTLVETTSLPDHYNFNSELLNIHVGKTLIFTHKDAVKIWPQHPIGLAVPLLLDIPPDFYTALLGKLRQTPSH
jgi:tetraacyldisaccharide 4'-kinase